jgi:hypothetical protein
MRLPRMPPLMGKQLASCDPWRAKCLPTHALILASEKAAASQCSQTWSAMKPQTGWYS